MKGYIYVRTSITGRQYVGQTRDIKTRRKNYDNYDDLFTTEVFEYEDISDEDLTDVEDWMIVLLDTLHPNGYNDRGPNGESERSRKRRAQAVENITDETRQKLSQASKGRTHTDEAKRKISEANLGRQFSQETRAKMSRSQRLSEKNKGENNNNYRKDLRNKFFEICKYYAANGSLNKTAEKFETSRPSIKRIIDAHWADYMKQVQSEPSHVDKDFEVPLINGEQQDLF